ncbi:hypothetical protein [Neptunomonas sp.]|uniref:hypothetical protein n=1 Tax=Neptunomonas sp. TaxID=1971898 RepID=UPI0025E28838|nr:hypothetical protein [Neptunomonas sp.]
MRRWLKWLLVPLVLLLLVLGVQGYYWYQVKSDIDSLIASIRPFAKIEYGGISAVVFGEVVLKQVTIQPNAYQEKISIKRASLTSPSRTFFFTAHQQLRTGVLNDPVSLSLKGLSYDLNADYAKNIGFSSSVSSNTSLDTLVCGDTKNIDQAALLAMGYRLLQGDVNLLLESSANKTLMKVRLGSEFAELIKGEINFWLALHQGGTLRRDDLVKTAVQMFRITVSDLGYNQRWKAYCAQQEGKKPSEYLEYYRNALVQSLGGEGAHYKGERLLEALVSARSERSIVAARLEPAVPVGLGILASPEGAESLFSSAEFAIQVNGKVLELVESEWQVIRKLFSGNVRLAALAVVDEKDIVLKADAYDRSSMREIIPGVMPIRPYEAPKSFLKTSVGDLSSYVGSAVKLRTFFGREMRGTLISVNSGAISIRHQVEQGRATFPVAKDKIALIEVYR